MGKKEKRKDIIPNAREECISKTYGSRSFIDSYRVFSSGLDGLVKTLNIDVLKIFQEDFLENWNLLVQKAAYSYENFKRLEDYELDIYNLTKEHYLSEMKNDYDADQEIEQNR